MGSITHFASSSLRRSAADAADTVRDRAHQAADAGSGAFERMGSLIDDLHSMMGEARKSSGRELTSLRKQMSKKLHVAGDVLDSLSSDAAVVARNTVKRTNSAIRAHPMQAVGIVAAVGLVLGFLLTRRSGE